jgi:hypothetical protein
MVAQDVKSTNGRHRKTLFINRSIKVELKKHIGISAVFIGRDHRADRPSPEPQKSSHANLFPLRFSDAAPKLSVSKMNAPGL